MQVFIFYPMSFRSLLLFISIDEKWQVLILIHLEKLIVEL